MMQDGAPPAQRRSCSARRQREHSSSASGKKDGRCLMEHIVSRGHTRPLTEINFTTYENGTLLISSAHDKTPQVRHGESGNWIGSFFGHKGAVWSAKIDSKTQTLAATASGDFTAKLWCATTGKELHEFKHKHVVRTVDFSQDTMHVATGCQDGLIRIFDICRPEADPLILNGAHLATGLSLSSPTKVAWGLSDSNIIYAGTKNGSIQKWDVRVGQGIIGSVSLGANAISDLEVSQSSDKLIVACEKQIVLLSSNDLVIEKSHTMPDALHFREEGGVSLHSNGSRFIAGGSDLWLREFDTVTGEVLRTFKGHHGPVRCVRYHPSYNMVASGSEDGTIRLWNLLPPQQNLEGQVE